MTVPPHEETQYITRVHNAYLQRLLARDCGETVAYPPSIEFNVEQNHVLSTAFRFPPVRSGAPVRSTDFHFSNQHDHYKNMLWLPVSLPLFHNADKIKVLIMDTGLAADLDASNFRVIGKLNFVDHNSRDVHDDNIGIACIISLLIKNDVIVTRRTPK